MRRPIHCLVLFDQEVTSLRKHWQSTVESFAVHFRYTSVHFHVQSFLYVCYDVMFSTTVRPMILNILLRKKFILFLGLKGTIDVLARDEWMNIRDQYAIINYMSSY